LAALEQVIEEGWHRTFDDPIPLPVMANYAPCASNFIANLPKREHDSPAWRAATEALLLVAEHGGDTMSPGMGIMRALYGDESIWFC